MLRRVEAWNLRRDFLEHAVEHGVIRTVDAGDVTQIEPETAASDRVHYLTAAEIADLAFAPEAAGFLRAGLHQAVMFARIALDQLGELVGGEQRRLVKPVGEPDRLLPPEQ